MGIPDPGASAAMSEFVKRALVADRHISFDRLLSSWMVHQGTELQPGEADELASIYEQHLPLSAQLARAPKDKAPPDFLWLFPFILILGLPAATVPWTTALVGSACGAMEHDSLGFETAWVCDTSQLLIALLPGVLNLLPALWLLSPRQRVRRAALTATLLGATRLLLPALVYLVRWPSVELRGFATPAYSSTTFLSLVLWIVSAAAIPIFAWLTDEGQGVEAVPVQTWKELTARPSFWGTILGWPGPWILVLILPFLTALVMQLTISDARLATLSHIRPPVVEIASAWGRQSIECLESERGSYVCSARAAWEQPRAVFALYLLPVLWLFSPRPWARWAALNATALGLVQSIVGALLITPVIRVDCTRGSCVLDAALPWTTAWAASTFFWMLSVCCVAAFYIVFVRRKQVADEAIVD